MANDLADPLAMVWEAHFENHCITVLYGLIPEDSSTVRAPQRHVENCDRNVMFENSLVIWLVPGFLG